MRKKIYTFLLALLCVIPVASFAQGWIPWPAKEDTLYIVAPSDSLNKVIAADTAGNGWQGAAGREKFLAGTRVYVLQANQTYYMSSALNLKANRALRIRGEYGRNYTIPTMGNYASIDWRPKIVMSRTAVSTALGNFTQVNAANDTLVFKNIAFVGYDDNGDPNMVDAPCGNLINSNSSATNECLYIDSCFFRNVSGSFIQCQADVKTIRVQNCFLLDGGFEGSSNFGAGRGTDFRNAGVDTADFQNNTYVNLQDRVIRHLVSVKPIKSFIFNHNTVINSLSYTGMLSLGWVDSSGAGVFRITNNIFLDNFAMGPDTDAIRQSEMTDNPDTDPLNGLKKLAWIVARPNGTANITPWVISNNYYCISDSGAAIRNAQYPLHPGATSAVEPILTSDIARQLNANGGNSSTAFTKVNMKVVKAPKLMTKLIRWYWSPLSASTNVGVYNPDSTYGAGAGKQKTGSAGTPATNFTKISTANGTARWPYDYNRKVTEWYADSLNCKIAANSTTTALLVSTDGKVVGDPKWGAILVDVSEESNMLPSEYGLSQNYPNPFNPTTTLTYTMSKAGLVSVKIYDILGREVETLVNEIKQAGSNTITWDATRFASGVYFCKMQSGSFSEIKKLTLMK
jgi:hypothetical protein